MSKTTDAELRRLQRELRSSPTDLDLQDRTLRLLSRRGQSVEAARLYLELDRLSDAPVEVLSAASRILWKSGERVEACRLFDILWEASPEQVIRRHSTGLHYRETTMTRKGLARLVEPDLERFAPDVLSQHFPRRKDGHYSLNTTRFLKRYMPRERFSEHRRLILVAWTPGTTKLSERPKLRGQRVIVVGLETRSTRGRFLEPEEWSR